MRVESVGIGAKRIEEVVLEVHEARRAGTRAPDRLLQGLEHRARAEDAVHKHDHHEVSSGSRR